MYGLFVGWRMKNEAISPQCTDAISRSYSASTVWRSLLRPAAHPHGTRVSGDRHMMPVPGLGTGSANLPVPRPTGPAREQVTNFCLSACARITWQCF